MSGGVIEALGRYLGSITPLRATAHPWVSGCLTGVRHRIDCLVAVDAPVDTIADADLPIAHGFIAGVAIRRCGTRTNGMSLSIDVLTIDA